MDFKLQDITVVKNRVRYRKETHYDDYSQADNIYRAGGVSVRDSVRGYICCPLCSWSKEVDMHYDDKTELCIEHLRLAHPKRFVVEYDPGNLTIVFDKKTGVLEKVRVVGKNFLAMNQTFNEGLYYRIACADELSEVVDCFLKKDKATTFQHLRDALRRYKATIADDALSLILNRRVR